MALAFANIYFIWRGGQKFYFLYILVFELFFYMDDSLVGKITFQFIISYWLLILFFMSLDWCNGKRAGHKGSSSIPGWRNLDETIVKTVSRTFVQVKNCMAKNCPAMNFPRRIFLEVRLCKTQKLEENLFSSFLTKWVTS